MKNVKNLGSDSAPHYFLIHSLFSVAITGTFNQNNYNYKRPKRVTYFKVRIEVVGTMMWLVPLKNHTS